jgi:hypothetical protein
VFHDVPFKQPYRNDRSLDAKEPPVDRFALFACLTLPACAGIGPGKVLLTEDTRDHYVQLREGRPGYVLSTIGHVESRPDLKDLREVHGNLDFICAEIQGLKNPRIVIESKNKAFYQVVYRWGDREALKVIAKRLGLVVAQEDREIAAITIRASVEGHKLKPAANAKQVNVEDIACDVEGRWLLDGVTVNDLARFLEIRSRRPVVNLTSLDGRWSILLSEKAVKRWPGAGETARLDDLGLELRWEMVKIPITVVKDHLKEKVN